MDLNCLEPVDAQQILKTKIFENALVIYNQYTEKTIKKNISHVLQIICGKNHFIEQKGTKPKNILLDFIKNEL
jgi:hypothetical protein